MSVPTLYEEINRKAIETLERQLGRHGRGELTDKEFSIALGTMYDCLAGLVDKQIIDYIEMAYINER
jgi:hypothetical protein